MTSEKKKDLLIIIPAHNEENNLPKVFETMDRYDVRSFADILVINDASNDSTERVIKDNGAECITFIFNLGYGNALQAGYKYAADNDYKYIIQMDADGQHDPCNIKPIYDCLLSEEKPDVALGSRFMDGSGEYDPGFAKRLGFRWFAFLFRIFGGDKLHDATTGLQGLSKAAFSYYAGFDNFDAKYPDTNMILEMKLLGFKIKPVPAVMHLRTEGKGMHSGIINPIKYMLRSTIAVVTVWIRYKFYKKDFMIRKEKNNG